MTQSQRADRRELERERYLLRPEYEWLYDVVLAILAEHDPIGIALSTPPEYDPEVRTILPRLGGAATIESPCWKKAMWQLQVMIPLEQVIRASTTGIRTGEQTC
jgi:hypothetical protein